MPQRKSAMLYLKVELGLPIERPFDYLVPFNLEDKIALGSRVWVPFRDKKMLGYIVGTSHHTTIKKVKPIYGVIDGRPILNKEMLTLTKEVSLYYFCSWGEAIEAALPEALRKGKVILAPKQAHSINYPKQTREVLLLQDLAGVGRWEVYWQKVEEALRIGKGIIFLSPEIEQAVEIRELIQDRLKTEVSLLHSRQTHKENLAQWLKIKNNQAKIVVGTRLAIFAPINNLGLVIIDNENDPSFKQDQSPHYHAREVAFMRTKISRANLIMSDINPSLESLYLARRNKIKFRRIEKEYLTQTKIVDMKKEIYSKIKRMIFSYPLLDMLSQSIQQKKKVIIFLNKRGFATFASCRNCRTVLRCPRCNVNLIYHFKEGKLICHFCNFKMQPPEICPECNSSYIRYSGIGTEKVESELARLYPTARILRIDKYQDFSPEDADIIVSSKPLLKQKIQELNLIGVVSLDNSLNRLDFRAAEKTFSLILGLMSLEAKNLIIQTNLTWHYCFKAILNNDVNIFYEKEFRLRRQLGFPPFNHFILIKVRGRNLEKVKDKSQLIFERLNKINKDKAIKVVSCFASSPLKLRENYYWQILIKSKSIEKARNFLKKGLKGIRPSGIIVTVDVDPI
jgi:primosomal protein N' (replication factor Y)